jgi:hypothetical protein
VRLTCGILLRSRSGPLCRDRSKSPSEPAAPGPCFKSFTIRVGCWSESSDTGTDCPEAATAAKITRTEVRNFIPATLAWVEARLPQQPGVASQKGAGLGLPPPDPVRPPMV